LAAGISIVFIDASFANILLLELILWFITNLRFQIKAAHVFPEPLLGIIIQGRAILILKSIALNADVGEENRDN
jgi:hypothetical protein